MRRVLLVLAGSKPILRSSLEQQTGLKFGAQDNSIAEGDETITVFECGRKVPKDDPSFDIKILYGNCPILEPLGKGWNRIPGDVEPTARIWTILAPDETPETEGEAQVD